MRHKVKTLEEYLSTIQGRKIWQGGYNLFLRLNGRNKYEDGNYDVIFSEMVFFNEKGQSPRVTFIFIKDNGELLEKDFWVDEEPDMTDLLIELSKVGIKIKSTAHLSLAAGKIAQIKPNVQILVKNGLVVMIVDVNRPLYEENGLPEAAPEPEKQPEPPKIAPKMVSAESDILPPKIAPQIAPQEEKEVDIIAGDRIKARLNGSHKSYIVVRTLEEDNELIVIPADGDGKEKILISANDVVAKLAF